MFSVQRFEQAWILGLGLLIGIVLFVFFLKRLLAWMDRRGWIMYSGDPPTYGTLGNAFMELQKIAQPQYEYVLETKEEEEQKREQDDEGGPDDPTRGVPK